MNGLAKYLSLVALLALAWIASVPSATAQTETQVQQIEEALKLAGFGSPNVEKADPYIGVPTDRSPNHLVVGADRAPLTPGSGQTSVYVAVFPDDLSATEIFDEYSRRIRDGTFRFGADKGTIFNLGPVLTGVAMAYPWGTANVVALAPDNKTYPTGFAIALTRCSNLVITAATRRAAGTPFDKWNQTTDGDMKAVMVQLGKDALEPSRRALAQVSTAIPGCSGPGDETLELDLLRQWYSATDEWDYAEEYRDVAIWLWLIKNGSKTSEGPVDFTLEFDNAFVVKQQSPSGQLNHRLRFPESIPVGRSTHTLKATARKNAKEISRTWDIEIVRDLQPIFIELDNPGMEEREPGETVVISGKVHDVEYNSVEATIGIVNGHDLTEPVVRTRTDADGRFSQSVRLFTNLSMFETLYIEAHPIQKNEYKSERVNKGFALNPKGLALVTLTTDKVVYKPGESVQVSGIVTGNGKPVAGTVLMKFDGHELVPGAVTTGADGRFQFSLPLANLANQINTSGMHYVSARPEVQGYTRGIETGAYFQVQPPGDACSLVEVSIVQMQGKPTIAGNAGAGIFPEAVADAGTKLAQGLSIQTRANENILLRFELDNQIVGGIAIGGDSKPALGKVCRDAEGKIHATLIAERATNIYVHLQNPNGGAPDLNVVTPAAVVSSIKTEYLVAVASDKTTTIVALEGVVRVASISGDVNIELPAVNQITLRPGVKPDAGNIKPYDGRIDPMLQPFVGGNSASPAVPQPNTAVSQMTLQAAQRFAHANEIVRVPVWLIKPANVANLNFEIAYDPTVIQPEGNLENDRGSLLDNALYKPNPKQAGRILIGFAQTTGIQREVGTVVELPFRVVGKPGDRSPLNLTVTAINDPNGGALTIDRIHGQIVVVNDDGTLPSGPGGNSGGGGSGGGVGGGGGSGNGPGGGIAQGDCDGSGTVNELDALCALEMSVGLRDERSYVDADRSGLPITSRDAVIILQQAVGQ